MLDIEDRRNLIIQTSSKHRNDKKFWSVLFNLHEEEGFFNNLIYYLISCYDDGFLSLDISRIWLIPNDC